MRIAPEEEVTSFLQEVNRRLRESYNNLYIPKRTNGEDKNDLFMIEYGLNHEMVCEHIMELDLLNYSKTEPDRDPKRDGEVWFFGKVIKPTLASELIEVYIKLKLQRKVVCISFHPKEFHIDYPYLND